MKVRHIDHRDTEGFSSQFNVHATSEVLVTWKEGDASSEFTRELEVKIGDAWKNMNRAFQDRDLITDNHNTHFFPPPTPEDKARGYTI